MRRGWPLVRPVVVMSIVRSMYRALRTCSSNVAHSLAKKAISAINTRSTQRQDTPLDGKRASSLPNRDGRVEACEQLRPRGDDPFRIARELGEVNELREQRIVTADAGRLQERVILKTFGENLPSDRIDRTLRTGIDDERIAVGPARPAIGVRDEEGVDQLGRL